MNKNSNSEVIRCPNEEWRLYQRKGVFYADGRKHGCGKQSLGTRDRKKAIEQLFLLDKAIEENALTALETHPGSKKQQPGPVPIRYGWEQYIEKKSGPIHLGGLKPSSIAKYKQHMNRFVSYSEKHGLKDWADVDEDYLKLYGKELSKTLSPVTVFDDLVMEVSVSNWLIRRKLIPSECKIDWTLPKPPGAERYCYERDEVSRMLVLASALKKNRWLHSAIFLLSHTGLRIGEAINLKWPDIDLKREVLHVRDESFKKKGSGKKRRLVKDKESRIIPNHSALQRHFMECSNKTGYVLTGDRGRQLNYNHALDMFKKKIIEPLIEEFPTPEGELGFKDGRFHSFRHFFISECFDAGIPECDIQVWVGHSDSKIVKRYRHIRDETAKANLRLGKFGAV